MSRRRGVQMDECVLEQSSSVETGKEIMCPVSINNYHQSSNGSCSATPDCSDKNEDGCLCSLNVVCE